MNSRIPKRAAGWSSGKPATTIRCSRSSRRERIFEELDADGRVVAKTYAPLTLRWVYRYEMQHLLELSGLAVEALYGSYERGPFRHGGEQVWVARRG